MPFATNQGFLTHPLSWTPTAGFTPLSLLLPSKKSEEKILDMKALKNIDIYLQFTELKKKKKNHANASQKNKD